MTTSLRWRARQSLSGTRPRVGMKVVTSSSHFESIAYAYLQSNTSFAQNAEHQSLIDPANSPERHASVRPLGVPLNNCLFQRLYSFFLPQEPTFSLASSRSLFSWRYTSRIEAMRFSRSRVPRRGRMGRCEGMMGGIDVRGSAMMWVARMWGVCDLRLWHSDRCPSLFQEKFEQ
jgi:hypothetical protein